MSFFLLYLQAKAITALVVVMSLKPSPISAGLPCLLPLVSNRSKTMWYCMVTVMECLSLPLLLLLVHWYNILSTSDYLEDELRRREMVHVLVSALSICFYSNKAHNCVLVWSCPSICQVGMPLMFLVCVIMFLAEKVCKWESVSNKKLFSFLNFIFGLCIN